MNLPNKLSLTRLIVAPIMIFFYLATFIPYGKFIACGLFIFGAITDFLDGKIARKYNLITDLGKFLDPIADKLLVTSALVLVACDGTIIAPFGVIALVIVIARDLSVDMLRMIAANKGRVIAAYKFGKYKTFSQDIALPILIVYAGLLEITTNSTLLSIFKWTGYGFLAIAVVLTFFSLIVYISKNTDIFVEKKENDAKKE